MIIIQFPPFFNLLDYKEENFIDPYCKVNDVALKDAACDVMKNKQRLLIREWTEEYNPEKLGEIKVTVQIENPEKKQDTAAGVGDF